MLAEILANPQESSHHSFEADGMMSAARYFVARAPDPETFHWFDIRLRPRHAVDLSIDDDLVRLVSHLPFDRCAVCFVDADGRRAMLALNQGALSVTAAGLIDVGGGKMEPIPAAGLRAQ